VTGSGFSGAKVKQFWALMLGILALVTCAVGQSETLSVQSPGETPSDHFRMAQTLTYSEKLPDAPSATRPLSGREKFQLFTDDAQSPLTFFSAGVTAGFNTSTNRVYGGGWNGFGRNYAAAVAEHETASFFGRYLFPTLLNQDPRYHPSEKNGFWSRSTYAASRVLITRNDAGQKTVNTSYLLGALVSTAIANSYRPVHRTAGQTMVDFGSNVGSDAGINILKEFWPQVRSAFAPLTPKSIRRLHNRIVGHEQPVGLVDLNSK
jgi:hypothetical protein